MYNNDIRKRKEGGNGEKDNMLYFVIRILHTTACTKRPAFKTLSGKVKIWAMLI